PAAHVQYVCDRGEARGDREQKAQQKEGAANHGDQQKRSYAQRETESEKIGRPVTEIGLLDDFLQAPQQADPAHPIAQERETPAMLASQQLGGLRRPCTGVGAQLAKASAQVVGRVLFGNAPQPIANGVKRGRKERKHDYEEPDGIHFSFTSCTSVKIE